MRWLCSLLIFISILSSCSQPLPVLQGVDLVAWKEDRKACGGKRATMGQAIKVEAEKLKGLSEMEIIGMLGNPDENELYERNQKFYTYYITAGPTCPEAATSPDKLIIRFTAMGYAQLVGVESN